MKPFEIKVARMRRNLSQKDMAKKLGISALSYSKKERGDVRFTDPEKVIVAKELALTAAEVNEYFFDGLMPTN